MKELFTLGDLYVSDFLKDGESPRGGSVEMKMMLEPETGAVRLEKIAPLRPWAFSNRPTRRLV